MVASGRYISKGKIEITHSEPSVLISIVSAHFNFRSKIFSIA